MKVGDIAHIRKADGGFWKGEVVKISEECDAVYGVVKYPVPIASIRGIGNPGYAVQSLDHFEAKNGEYWEKVD